MTSGMKKQLICNDNALESKNVKTDDILEYDYINYISIPSLESMAVVRISTGLCKQPDIRDAIRQQSLEFDPIIHGTVRSYYGSELDESLNQIEKEILNKLSFLPLPNQLKANVSDSLRPIELQILEWLRYDRKDVEYIDSICWTTQGTIDKIKTLKQLIHEDTGQHIHSNFKLACTYCLEESIPGLWGTLPVETKEDYLCGERVYENYDNHLIAYWTSIVNNELSGFFGKLERGDRKNIYKSNHSVNENMFTLALSEGNNLAVKYFWYKLTEVEIYSNLEQWINAAAEQRKNYSNKYPHTIGYADILYFLLSKVNDKEQQKRLLQKNADVVLVSLLEDWPWQRFLLPTIKGMWEIIDEEVYVKLLKVILEKIEENQTTENLLRNLWCHSPIDLKNSFIQHILNFNEGTVVKLLTVEDVRTIKIIFKDTNMEVQKRIIFSSLGRGYMYKAIYKGKFSQFGNILIEILSESDINRVKERIVSYHGNRLCYDWLYQNDWNVLEEFLHWAFTTRDQIDNFKSEILDKIDITHALLKKGDYKLVDRFLDWCFGSEREINQFKKHFAKSKPEIVELGHGEWCLFEKFIDWCFDSAEEINDFKSDALRSGQLRRTIHDSIEFRFDFEYIDKLLSWCCRSHEEIQQYKAEFVFSDEWIRLLQRFVSNYKIDCSEWDNWELIKKLFKLFSPLEEDIIADLKEKIESEIDFDIDLDYRNRIYPIEKKHLFRLLDNENYNMDDDRNTTLPTKVRVLTD